MKRTVLVAAAILLPICCIAIAWLFVGRTDTPTASLSSAATSCLRRGTVHAVVLAGGRVVPEHVDAQRCDTLTITNEDNRYRLVAFGPHEKHIAYDGITEKLLALHQSLTVTLVTPGTFIFHDHLDDVVAGSFTVHASE